MAQPLAQFLGERGIPNGMSITRKRDLLLNPNVIRDLLATFTERQLSDDQFLSYVRFLSDHRLLSYQYNPPDTIRNVIIRTCPTSIIRTVMMALEQDAWTHNYVRPQRERLAHQPSLSAESLDSIHFDLPTNEGSMSEVVTLCNPSDGGSERSDGSDDDESTLSFIDSESSNDGLAAEIDTVIGELSATHVTRPTETHQNDEDSDGPMLTLVEPDIQFLMDQKVEDYDNEELTFRSWYEIYRRTERRVQPTGHFHINGIRFEVEDFDSYKTRGDALYDEDTSPLSTKWIYKSIRSHTVEIDEMVDDLLRSRNFTNPEHFREVLLYRISSIALGTHICIPATRSQKAEQVRDHIQTIKAVEIIMHDRGIDFTPCQFEY